MIEAEVVAVPWRALLTASRRPEAGEQYTAPGGPARRFRHTP